MFLKIVKLLLRTRFTKSFFGLLGFVLLIDLSTIPLLSSGSGGSLSLISILFVALLYYVFVALLILFGNGLSLTKPDQEFLLTSSVPGKQMPYALFLSQYVALGLFFLVMSLGLAVNFISNPLVSIVIILDFAMLSGALTSIGVAITEYGNAVRVTVLALVSLFLFSFLLNFPFSPFAIISGHILEGSISIIPFFALTFAFALRWINSQDLTARTPKIVLGGKQNFKDEVSFSELSPERAIFNNYFFHAYQGNAATFMGQNFSRSNRIRLKGVMRVMIILSVILGALLYYGSTRMSPTEILSFEFIILFYLGIYPPMILFSSTFAMERLWLAGTSIQFARYMRIMVAAQMAQAALVNLPFFLAFVFLSLSRNSIILPVAVAELVVIPISVGVMASLSATARPPQVQETIAVTRRMGIRRMIYMLPYFTLAVSGMVAGLVNILYVTVPAFIGIAILFLMLRSSDRWDRVMSRLSENNYV